jgi:hypothetical protein
MQTMRTNKGWHIRLEWKLNDLWVGLYWMRIGNSVDIYICILPCVPIHLSWWWSTEPKGSEADE